MTSNLSPVISARIGISEETLEKVCQKWGITSVAIFGSTLRRDFSPASDIDLLIDFSPEAKQSLFTLVRIQDELESLLNRSVDLVVRKSIENSENWIRRHEILSTAKVIYEQR